MESKPFVGFTAIDTSNGVSWKLRVSKIAFTFTAEALAIGETLEIIEKIDSEQNFMICSDSESALKRNKISHISQMLKDKIDSNREGNKSNFTVSRGTVELKLMRELTRRQSDQSK
jgi:hypothetical protein